VEPVRLGILDIGSNSAQLVIVDVRIGAPPLPVVAVKEPTLLSERFDENGAITEEGMARVAEAVHVAVQVAVRQDVDQLYCFATSAVRDAHNRGAVLARIEAVAGVRPQFLTGDQEARLTYLAARRWYGWSTGRLLLVDIGGGSMEVVLGRDTEPDLTLSLPMGAGRLTNRFITSDPPTRGQVRALRRHVRDGLGEVRDRLCWEGPPRQAAATSKTFKQLARLAGAARQRRGPFPERVLRYDDMRANVRLLQDLPVAERANLRGVSSSRARQILAGAVVVEETMAAFGLDRVQICPWALREGIALAHVEAPADPSIFPLQPLPRLKLVADATPPVGETIALGAAAPGRVDLTPV
jgi:exopolyphosphatase/guanosine-5'-triphosphate,3'-diphosphate pyrophosphatase